MIYTIPYTPYHIHNVCYFRFRKIQRKINRYYLQCYSRWLLNQELLVSDKPEIKHFLSSKFDSNDKSYLLTWGKHKNKTIKWVFDNDKQYFKWMSKNEYIRDECKKLFSEIQSLAV